MGAAAIGQHHPQPDFRAPIHHSWHDLAREMTPDHDQHTLLLTLAGVLPQKVKETYAASHANPTQCAKELQLLTYDLIVMGHEAWKETHLVTSATNQIQMEWHGPAHPTYNMG